MLLFELDNYVHGNVVYNDTLNPKIYDEDDNMRSEVHEALMAVTKNFIEDIDLPNMVVHDIILTGSSANYNWTKFSDIDLHLISDVDIFADPHMAARYFRAAKNVWNNLHDVEIRGLDVEVYVEDNDEVNESLGRFSVLNNEWISKPMHNKPVFDEDAVNRKVRYLMKEIDHVMSSNDPEEIQHIKSKLWNMRKAGLARAGEFSVENLAFKVLRNMGYAQKILDAIRSAEDDEMSVREMKIEEMFNTGAKGFTIVNIDDRAFRSIQGWFPDAEILREPKDLSVTIVFDGGVTDEIDAKMDRFNSNWLTKSVAIY